MCTLRYYSTPRNYGTQVPEVLPDETILIKKSTSTDWVPLKYPRTLTQYIKFWNRVYPYL